MEARWPCPVCLGVKMEKTAIGDGADSPVSDDRSPLLLDHCPRCGGMWFEFGEIRWLRGKRPAALWKEVPTREDRHRAQCHSCRALIDRDALECAVCGAKTHLDCPMCDKKMHQIRHGELTLDVCKRCKGVWFDHHELEAIWTLERDKLVARRRAGGKLKRTAEDGSAVLLETFIWAPELVVVGAHAAGHAVSVAVEVAPTVLEAVGEAAASVFEVIVEIVAGIFG